MPGGSATIPVTAEQQGDRRATDPAPPAPPGAGARVTAPAAESVLAALTSLLQQAADEAAAQPGKLADAVSDATDQLTALPEQVYDELKDAVEHPDWFSLLVAILLAVRELDRDHLSVGKLEPGDGWAPAVTLTHHDQPAGVDEATTVGLSLCGDGTHGVLARCRTALPMTFGSGGLRVTLAGSGNADWRIGFTGGLRPPTGAGTLDVTVEWDPGLHVEPAAGISFGVGPLRFVAHLATTAPLWSLELGLGTAGPPPAVPGVGASLDLRPLLGDLAGLVSLDVPAQRYSPRLTVSDGSTPVFDLGSGNRP